MGFGNCVLVRNSVVNMEVISDCGVFFDRNNLELSLSKKIQELVDKPHLVEEFRKKATSRIKKYYNWEWVTSFYETIFENLIFGKKAISYDAFIEIENDISKSSSDKINFDDKVNVLGIGINTLNLKKTIQILLKARLNNQ